MNIWLLIAGIVIFGVLFNKLIHTLFGKWLDQKDQELAADQDKQKKELDRLKGLMVQKENSPPKAEDLKPGDIEDFWKKENE